MKRKSRERVGESREGVVGEGHGVKYRLLSYSKTPHAACMQGLSGASSPPASGSDRRSIPWMPSPCPPPRVLVTGHTQEGLSRPLAGAE